MFISLTKDDFIKEINCLVSSDNDRQALLFVPKNVVPLLSCYVENNRRPSGISSNRNSQNNDTSIVRFKNHFSVISNFKRFKSMKKLFTAVALLGLFNSAVMATSEGDTSTEPSATSKKPTKKALTLAGGWKTGFSGNINTHYVYTSVEQNPVQVDGGFVPTGKAGVHSVQNGLLPASLVFSANKVTADSLEIGATIGTFVGTVSNGALSYSDVDVRQAFMTISKKKMGTFLLGRNFGIFGFDAIINDMSLVGQGAVLSPKNPANTSLGGIGFGYIYCDRLSQINYTTPTFSGITLTAGVFQPINVLGGAETVSTSSGIHGKATYATTAGSAKINFSASVLSQDITPDVTNAKSVSATAFDVFGKLSAGAFGLSAYYYSGNGIGTTALFLQSTDAAGNARTSNGFYIQPTVTFGKTKIGVNYGVSNLTKNSVDANTLLSQHQRITVGVYHTITDGLTLVTEYTNLSTKNQGGASNTASSFNVGCMLFF